MSLIVVFSRSGLLPAQRLSFALQYAAFGNVKGHEITLSLPGTSLSGYVP